MTMTLYRADTRAPDVIRRNGFRARQAMTLLDARSHLLSWCGSNRHPGDLSQYITRSPKPIYVSTDLDETCGGYSHKGYIYQIEYDGLQKREWSEYVLGEPLGRKPNLLWPELYLDAVTLASANVIAVKHFGATREVTFLTPIKSADVRAYKDGAEGAFVAM